MTIKYVKVTQTVNIAAFSAKVHLPCVVTAFVISEMCLFSVHSFVRHVLIFYSFLKLKVKIALYNVLSPFIMYVT